MNYLFCVLRSEESGESVIYWSRTEADGDLWIQSDMHMHLDGLTKVIFAAIMKGDPVFHAKFCN